MDFIGGVLVLLLSAAAIVSLAMGLFFLQLCWSWHYTYLQ